MNYAEALAYLESFTDYERVMRPDDPTRFNLGRVVELLALMGHSEERYGVLHVVGTKGKGSTAVMMAGVLRAAGKRVALYTSPHLHTFRERIQIDGRLIAGEELGAMAEHIRPLVDREQVEHPELGRLTTFEVTTALALAYYARERVDYAVLEAGLGGRLDATNVVRRPLVTVISAIGLDHTQYLGHTVAAIAREKAAVIKPGGIVVSAEQRVEARVVIEEIAAAAGAQLSFAGREWRWEPEEGGETIAVRGPERSYEGISVPLLGQHQRENAALAVAAIDALRRYGVGISENAIREGIAAVRWPGRLEVLGERPLLLVDGAHNPESMRRLRQALTTFRRRLILVVGSSLDKDLRGIAEEIVPEAARVIVTRSNHPRSASPQAWAEIIAHYNVPMEMIDGVGEAIARARELAGPEDMICVTGSLFVVAEAREALLGTEAVERDEG